MAGKADFELVVGLNKKLSISNLEAGIQDAINSLNKKPPEIKIGLKIISTYALTSANLHNIILLALEVLEC